MRPLSWLLWRGEEFFSRIFARFFWAPTSAAVVITRDDEILAVERGEYLMLPGGIVEIGESFRETVKRETREETGLEIQVGERIQEKSRSTMGVEVMFRGEPVDGELEGSWEGEPRWIGFDEALESDWRFNRDISRFIDTG